MLATDGGSPRLGPKSDAPEGQRSPGTLLVTGHRLRWWKELLFTGAIYVFYESTRNLTKSGANVGVRERPRRSSAPRSGCGSTGSTRSSSSSSTTAGVLVSSNYFYGAGYVVSTLFALIWLYRRRPDHYPFWRNTLAIGTLLGLVGFRFYPLMPPRLLDVHLGELVYGFIDTLKEFPTLWSFDNSAMEKVSNQYAAMPSLHCGWAIWVMVSTFGLVRTQVMKVVVVLLPVTTIFVVVVTANHYLLDAVGGLRHHDHRLWRLHAGDPGRLCPLPGLPHEGSAGVHEG